MSNIEGTEIKTGNNLDNLTEFAVEISEWLTNGQPSTKPKTP